jgi:hypothetical protein
MAIAKELRDLLIPSKTIEFPGVLDLIKVNSQRRPVFSHLST